MREEFSKTFLPQCIAIGIGVEDFWNMTMRTLNPFLLADNIKRERENYIAWLNGFYVFNAVSVALAQSLGGNRNAKYIQEPIRITPYTKEEEARIAEKERKKAIAFFEAMEKSFKAKEEQDGRN